MSSFKIKKLFVSIILLATCDFIQGENIVFFFGVASYSHCITVWPLAERLAEKGHNVTFLSGHRAKKPHPKVHELIPKSLVDWMGTWEQYEGEGAFSNRKNGISDWWVLPDWGEVACDVLLSDQEVVKWIEKTPVDLVIIDSLFNDCAYAIAHRHKAKTMIFGTSTILPWHYDSFGIPAETSWIPDMVYYFPQNMTFMERVYSTVLPIYWNIIREWKYFPNLEKTMKEKLSLDVNVKEMERETSLVLLNTYFAEEFARSLPPLIVPVGGMHCKDKVEPLPKNMEDFISKPGAKASVYISFGSSVRISKSPPKIQNAFFTALEKLSNIQFIWKWEGDFPQLALPNVLFVKWAPQQSILAHPKIKAFVTHSGLLSIQEAVFHGVPLISLPVFAEQDYNAERIHRLEYGIRLEITEVTEDQLTTSITKIISDPKYANNMKLLSKRFKDRPMKPEDAALWWTEYVLRHEDTSFHSPQSIHQTWHHRRLLDVWAFIAIVLAVTFSILAFVFIQLVKCILCNQSSKSVPSKKKLKIK